ncbi:hypothetical protein BV372_25895 [Nostoc sp. T09]|nr:hypothetical protein BV372_25895 [Nostoc sp. T09]
MQYGSVKKIPLWRQGNREQGTGNRCVGWVERSETQQLQDFEVLGFVPQPNLHPLHPHHIFCEMV